MTGKKWRRESQKPNRKKEAQTATRWRPVIVPLFFLIFPSSCFFGCFFLASIIRPLMTRVCYCINRVQNGRCDFLSSFCRQSESRETVSFFSLVLVVEIDLLLQQNNNKKKKSRKRTTIFPPSDMVQIGRTGKYRIHATAATKASAVERRSSSHPASRIVGNWDNDRHLPARPGKSTESSPFCFFFLSALLLLEFPSLWDRREKKKPKGPVFIIVIISGVLHYWERVKA